MEHSPARAPAPPPRRPRISREFIEDHRRRRFVDASAELLHEFGRSGASVTNLVRLAGTARNTFYELFKSAEDCIGYGVLAASGELFSALEAQDGEGEWLAEVEGSVVGLYAAVAAEPLLAELLLIHSWSCRAEPGRTALPDGVERLAALLGRGRGEAEARGRRPPPAVVDECLAWGVVAPAARRVRSWEVERLPQESAGMASLICGYYLGPEAVEKIL